jgi:hypothetical protein
MKKYLIFLFLFLSDITFSQKLRLNDSGEYYSNIRYAIYNKDKDSIKNTTINWIKSEQNNSSISLINDVILSEMKYNSYTFTVTFIIFNEKIYVKFENIKFKNKKIKRKHIKTVELLLFNMSGRMQKYIRYEN